MYDSTTEWGIKFDGTLMKLSLVHDGDRYFDGTYEIMQYTGLKDRNGKEVFEGDIVKAPTPWDSYEDRVNIVKYEDGRWNYSYSLDAYTDVPERDWEVLGNIYENPELLEH